MAGGMSFNMGAKKGPKLAFGLKSQQKAPRPQAAFAPDSDDEGAAEPETKRARRAFSGLQSLPAALTCEPELPGVAVTKPVLGMLNCLEKS